ncbi:MAG TPA: substrate-binding domain-containing protein, partial [Bacilli bacterium]
SPENTNNVTDERAKGFEKAFLNKRLSMDKNLWCILGLDIILSGKAPGNIKEFFEERPEITAVFTVNSELAEYTYSVLIQMHEQIEKHIELVSFDQPNIQNFSYLEQNEEEICNTTVQLLLSQIEGHHYNPQRIVVPVKLVHK